MMRACEGCRRRKIKCDAATTNTWPCAACIRLKLNCVPPSLNYDRLHGGGGTYSGLEGVLDFDHSSASGDDDHYAYHSEPTQYFDFGNPSDSMPNSQISYGHDLADYSTPENSERDLSQPDFSYNNVSSMPMTLPENYQNPAGFQPINATPPQPLHNENTWENEQRTASDLSDVLGELSIKENGVGKPQFGPSKPCGTALRMSQPCTYRSRRRVLLKRQHWRNMKSSSLRPPPALGRR